MSGRRLSYKFQRLAEKIRQAIDSGELSGKLPGERALAKRFHANAKTLSKALTDLAAEGVLERSIGRGTFVKGSAPAYPKGERWLLLCDAHTVDSPLARQIIESFPQAQVSTDDPSEMRPSFINQFSAVIDFASEAHESFLRAMVVRNMPVVIVGREPQTYSTHAVVIDAAQGLSRIARDLLLSGHRRLCAVEARDHREVSHVLRTAAQRYAPDATIDSCTPGEIATLIDHGVTAAVCDSPESATIARRILESRGVSVPGQMSLAAVGCITDGDLPCTGWFVKAAQIVETLGQILRDTQPRRPATVWLTGQFSDTGTTTIRAALPGELPALAGTTPN